MSIKRWITVSYLVVMVIPILSLYLLYNVLIEYDAKADFKDFLNINNQIIQIEKNVLSADLYLYPYKKPKFDQIDLSSSHILLFSNNGKILFNSNKNVFIADCSIQELYTDLYDLKSGYRAYTLKKPVFQQNKIVGFYKIAVMRNSFTKGINDRIKLVAVILTAILVILFLLVSKFIDRKLNKPMKYLIEEISEFAQGRDVDVVNHSANDEIGKLIMHFRNMKKEISVAKENINKQQKDKEYMIAAISHDLKTPLTAIMAYAESLKHEKDLFAIKTEEYTNVILNKAGHMTKMLDDLLMYSVLSNDYKLNLVEVDGQEFFEMLLSGYAELCKSENINLNVSCMVDNSYNLDVKNIIRVMDNLISNALRYTPANKMIGLAALTSRYKLPDWVCTDFVIELKESLKDGGCLFFIQNEGEGLDYNGLGTMFDPLYKCDSSRHDDKSGTGLGLSIAKGIIEKHGGSIKALSNGTSDTLVMCWIKDSKTNPSESLI